MPPRFSTHARTTLDVVAFIEALRGERLEALVDEHWKHTLAIPEGTGDGPRGLPPVATAVGDFGAEGCVASAGGEGSHSEAAVSGPGGRAFCCDGAVLSAWGLHQVGSVRLNVQGADRAGGRLFEVDDPHINAVLAAV